MKGKGYRVAVSACLLGVNCRYNGGSALRERLLEDGVSYIPLCPEQLGGLPTPRNPAEIDKGDGIDVLMGNGGVVDIEGNDVTISFIRGANEMLNLIKRLSIRRALMKEESPSCGVKRIQRKGKSVQGMGVTTALLIKEGIEVIGID